MSGSSTLAVEWTYWKISQSLMSRWITSGDKIQMNAANAIIQEANDKDGLTICNSELHLKELSCFEQNSTCQSL